MIDDSALMQNLSGLSRDIEAVGGRPVQLRFLYAACDALVKVLSDKISPKESSNGLSVFGRLHSKLKASVGDDEASQTIASIADFLRPEVLQLKLRRETGSADPFTPARFEMAKPVFEAWAPLGHVVHIAPGNAPAVGVLSVVEGLLSGNFNTLKTSSADGGFSVSFIEALCALDESGEIADRVIVLELRSSESEALQKVLDLASGIAVWGGEEAVNAIRAQAPRDARVIEWGHKLSFSYVAREHSTRRETIVAIAKDICALNQQACSSPQCVYVETTNYGDLRTFANSLAEELTALTQASIAGSMIEPEEAGAAEISMTLALHECEAALGLGETLRSASGAWRILVDRTPALRASPLFRTIWLKALPAGDIFGTLWPMRAWLQTAGLSCDAGRVADLSAKLIAAGILRITECGHMLDSYSGEPHDGVYALPRYMRRISLQLPEIGSSVVSFGELMIADEKPLWGRGDPPRIMDKAAFQALSVDESCSHLYFKSGGSTGEPKISVFSYDDYHGQMQLAAEGLFAAGLDPGRHRCMNLFFGGGLYGGFLSFFTILESMGAVQLPMAAHLDFKFVGDMILRHKVDTILGMPSYLMRLFDDAANRNRFAQERPVKRVFYGGEHFSEAQKKIFQETYGVGLIKSATYGSVDSGPLGYQCAHTSGSVHHLHHRLQFLEILALDHDAPVAPGTPGRLVFSSRMRQGQALNRYDIGDLGRFVVDENGQAGGRCPCGRSSPRFELLGRHGDVFRAGGAFFNYQKFLAVLEESSGITGELQIVVDRVSGIKRVCDRVILWSSSTDVIQKKEAIIRNILLEMGELHELVNEEGTLVIEVRHRSSDQLVRTPGSGKLRHVIDLR